MLNSIGLQNPGVAHLKDIELPWLAEVGATAIVNVSGHSFDEYVQVIEALEDAPVDAYEVNISCPNVDAGGMTIGTMCTVAWRRWCRCCRAATKRPLIVKLTPNVTDIAEIARAAEAAGADAHLAHQHAARHGHRRRAPPPEARARAWAALSGPAVKPVALRMVWQVRKAVDVPLLGMGGISHRRPTPWSSCWPAPPRWPWAPRTSSIPHATVDVIDGISAVLRVPWRQRRQRADRSVAMLNRVRFRYPRARPRHRGARLRHRGGLRPGRQAAGQGHVDEDRHDAVLRRTARPSCMRSRSAASRCSSTSSSTTSRTRCEGAAYSAAGQRGRHAHHAHRGRRRHDGGGARRAPSARRGRVRLRRARQPSASRCSPP